MPRIMPHIPRQTVIFHINQRRTSYPTWKHMAARVGIRSKRLTGMATGKLKPSKKLLQFLNLWEQPNVIDKPTIDELIALRHGQKSAAETYREAIKAQAKKHDMKPGALRRYINSAADDKLAALDEEATQVSELLAGYQEQER